MRDGVIGRRSFVRHGLAAAAGAAFALGAGPRPIRRTADAAPAPTAADLRLGVLLPEQDSALRGVRLGAREAEHAARLFGTSFTLHEAPPDAASAARLIREEQVRLLIGGGTAAQADALIIAAEAGQALLFNVGSARDDVRGRCSAAVLHILPDRAMRADALAAAGTGDGSTGTRRQAVAWHASLERFGAAQVTDRYRDAFGEPMDERAWAGWLAVKIVFDASQRTGTAEPAALAAFLLSPRGAWDGHKGVQLSFRPETRQLRQPLYVVEDERVVAEVPSVRELGERTHAELLDTIGPRRDDACQG